MSFNDHYIAFHQNYNSDDDIPEDHIVPTSANGNYSCPICQKKYLSSALLGEHFTLRHNDYSEMNTLDNNENCTSFFKV